VLCSVLPCVAVCGSVWQCVLMLPRAVFGEVAVLDGLVAHNTGSVVCCSVV